MTRSVKELAGLAVAALLGVLAATAYEPGAKAQRADDGPVLRQVPPSREVAQYSFSPIVRRAAPAVGSATLGRASGATSPRARRAISPLSSSRSAIAPAISCAA